MAVVQADLPAEFAATDATIVAFWISVATGEVEAALWTACGLDPDQGIKLLASHYLKQAGEGAAELTGTAAVVSERVGEVSTSYAAKSTSSKYEGAHPETLYGRAYDGLFARMERCTNRKPAAFFAKTNRTYP